MKNNINLSKRLDIVIKYLFIKAYVENIDYEFYKSLYRKHIKLQSGGIEDQKKNVNDFEKSFIQLIGSVKKKGFDKNYPVITNTAGDILDGAHRYACSLYFKIEPSFVFDNTLEGIDWSYSWFTKNNFTQDELLSLLGGYCDMSSKYSLLIVWPNISDHHSYIPPHIVGNIKIDIESKQNFKEIIYDIYSHDFGININIGAIEKANYLADTGTHIDIYLLDIEPEELYRNKTSIRASLAYTSGISDPSKAPYYTIHSGDTKEETKYLRKILLNPNNINHLKKRNFSGRKVFLDRLSSLNRHLKEKNISRNDICFVGSTSMEIFHLDTTSDIDFITSEYKNTGIVKITNEIDHLDYKYSKKYKNTDIIYNPNYHFFFRGLKCISLNILAEIKGSGTREKDIEQAKIIQDFLENNIEIKRSLFEDISLKLRYTKQRTLIKLLKSAIYITKKLHIYKGVSYLWRRFILKRNWK